MIITKEFYVFNWILEDFKFRQLLFSYSLSGAKEVQDIPPSFLERNPSTL